jgi:hypothetical protein
MAVGKMSRKVLNYTPLPLIIPGTLGIDSGPASDGVQIGTITKQAIAKAFAGDYADPVVFADETTGANNATANDMHLFPAAPAVGDTYNFSFGAAKGCELALTIGTKAVDPVYTAIWEYSKAANTWGTLTPLSDGTSDGTHGPFSVDATGAKSMIFAPPTDWVAAVVNAVSGLWVRARITAFTSITTVPLGSRVYKTDFTHGTGVKAPFDGTLDRVQWTAGTNSAANGDTKILLINVTKGTFATLTLTKATVVGELTGLGLGVAAGDQLVAKQISEDGTTEFAGVQLLLHFAV